MTRRTHGSLVAAILSLLAEQGALTRDEIDTQLAVPGRTVAQTLTRLRLVTRDRPKRVYIQRWVTDAEGQKLYPRPVYALGDRPDAPKPARNRQAANQRYYWSKKARTRLNSVFNLAITGRAYDGRKAA